ncbi:MAG: UvrD-helicase domain-containing protein, partial [Bacteroidota bacterium]
MTTGNLLVYRASAGSGKTHNLVFAFLRLLLLADDPRTVRQALAITFTRKASMEMKERILKQLRYMAMEPASRTADQRSDALESTLMKDLECSREILRNRSFQYLQHMLHRYNDTAISTIDSFITQLARPFYRELRTGLDFDIELDRDLVIEQALDEWMNNLGNDNQAVTDLLHFMAQNRNQKEQSWNTRTLLEKYAGFLFEDRTYAHLHQLLERSPESYQRHFDELEAKLQYHLDYTLKTAAKLAQEAKDLG